jgi:glycosyltransferase involved in cell wall biosynthesis
MKILLHTNALNERGTTVAVLDYARILRKLGYEPIIGYDYRDPSNNKKIISDTNQKYEISGYKNFTQEASKWKKSCDFAYFIKYGNNDAKLISGIQNIVHVVFQSYDPHGERYIYVSEWLARRMRTSNLKSILKVSPKWIDSFRNDTFDYLPHVVTLPETSQTMREEWGFPSGALIGGRHGGLDTFDISWVHKAIGEMLEANANLYFVFANTRKFIEHSRVKYLPTLTSREQTSSYLKGLDFYLHARSRGETFGLSLMEAMKCNIPVFSYSGGVDRNHSFMLRGSPYSQFKNAKELKERIQNIEHYGDLKRNFILTNQFSEEAIAYRFKEILDSLH